MSGTATQPVSVPAGGRKIVAGVWVRGAALLPPGGEYFQWGISVESLWAVNSGEFILW